RPEHGRHGALRVRGASSVEAPVDDFCPEGGHGHAGNADGVEVGGKEQAGLAVPPGKLADHVGPTGQDLLETDVCATGSEPGPDSLSAGGLPCVACIRGAGRVGVDTGDADELLEEGG